MTYATCDSTLALTNMLICDLEGNGGMRGHSGTLYGDVKNVEE
jgi:hypothetical protein